MEGGSSDPSALPGDGPLWRVGALGLLASMRLHGFD